MTGGSPQTDPRDDAEFRPWDAALPSDAAVVAAVKALLHGPGEWIGDGLQIAQLGQQIVRAVHAADEASGVRRVIRAEELQRVREAVSSVPFQPESEPLNVRQHSYWMGWMDCYATIVNALGIAADSPVGGAVVSAWSMLVAVAQHDTPRLVAALTAVLDRHAEDLHDARFTGYCKSCGNEFPCPDYRAVAAALEEQP